MIKGVNHITLAVQNVQDSFGFYKDILGLKPLCRWHKGAYFLVGDFWLCLNADLKRKPNACYTHYAFSVDADQFMSWKERLTDAGVKVFKENTSPGESFYFLDPDAHKLEIHVGNWQTRILSKKNTQGSWEDVEWFI